jgi:hypothetical protein
MKDLTTEAGDISERCVLSVAPARASQEEQRAIRVATIYMTVAVFC